MDELNNKNDKLISMMAAIDAVETIGFDFSDSGLSAAEIEEVCEAIGEVRQEWSRRIKRLPSAQPDLTPDGTLNVAVNVDVASVGRILLAQTGTQYGGLYYKDTQSERDIPMKPNETIDSSWGIRKKQAVCPKCDYYLGRVEFIGNPNGKKVTYCEICGQAIDWEGWDSDE